MTRRFTYKKNIVICQRLAPLFDMFIVCWEKVTKFEKMVPNKQHYILTFML